MKISQLFKVVLVSSFVAVPAMAASPLPLCGGDKAEKAEKADSDVKSEKKQEKKEASEKKVNGKEAA